eukprot:TRINITY_DN9343_c0_g1_i3.p1 TRINITY_DN9343_c0_g1~~TRINITY_DN9343_c0_g1_i3.p1  ORF type:complete len:381 (+),score=35.42 TRINITY_DN9343_c0_g1_i3:204-1346(+)
MDKAQIVEAFRALTLEDQRQVLTTLSAIYKSVDILSGVPLPVAERILSHLDGGTLLDLRRVCRRWRALLDECRHCWLVALARLQALPPDESHLTWISRKLQFQDRLWRNVASQCYLGSATSTTLPFWYEHNSQRGVPLVLDDDTVVTGLRNGSLLCQQHVDGHVISHTRTLAPHMIQHLSLHANKQAIAVVTRQNAYLVPIERVLKRDKSTQQPLADIVHDLPGGLRSVTTLWKPVSGPSVKDGYGCRPSYILTYSGLPLGANALVVTCLVVHSAKHMAMLSATEAFEAEDYIARKFEPMCWGQRILCDLFHSAHPGELDWHLYLCYQPFLADGQLRLARVAMGAISSFSDDNDDNDDDDLGTLDRAMMARIAYSPVKPL